MTRTTHETTSRTTIPGETSRFGTEARPEGLGGDPMHHPPKPADVGLREDNMPAGGSTRTDGRRGMAEDRLADDQRSITDLIKTLRDEATDLLRQEVQLAKTEMSEKASFFATQGGKLAGGIAVLAIGGLMLLFAVAYFVGAMFQAFLDIPPSTALGIGYAIVGAVVAIIGYVLYQGARSKISREPLAPERTINSLKDDEKWLTNKTETTR